MILTFNEVNDKILKCHKNTFFYRYNIIEVGKTVADV
jgi:hypothetical protein